MEQEKDNMVSPRKLELLAPAKNLECGIAAIDHGADAVYIGAPKFGARAAAGNSLDDIKQLCEYAHQFGAKVHVTVNTIIYDNEMKDTLEMIAELDRIGVDALLAICIPVRNVTLVLPRRWLGCIILASLEWSWPVNFR